MNEDVEITLQTEDVSVETPLVADYILPTATQDTLGGIKLGNNVSIDTSGHLSVPVASTTSLGVVQAGTGINIDTNGVISSNGEGYTLPEATKTTLGGVYVDDELSTTSTHPVQNAVVSLALAEATGDIDDLSTDVDNLSTGLGNLSTTVGNLSTTVGNLSSTVASNTSSISTLSSTVSSLSNTLGTVSGNVTTLQSNVATLQTESSEVYTYDDIDDQVWTAGSIVLCAYGMTGYINIDLEGSLTIASGASETIFTLPALLPEYTVTDIALIDDGDLKVSITSGGVISLENISSSSVTLTKVVANVPIIIASDNP